MCDIATALAVAGAVSGGAAAVGQMQSARAQQRGIDEARQQQAEEIAAKRDQTMNQRVAAARREAARRLVSAGEAGVGGASLAADIGNTFGRANQDLAIAVQQAGFEDRASQSNYVSELSQVRKPTALDAGLQIASGFNSGTQAGNSLKSNWTQLRNSLTVRGSK